ncbi:MAG: HEAT repeat domain-containing protein, partial [Pirellulales bacterium]
PYEMARSADRYPQERILSAARRASVADADAAELLDDGDAAVRWWTLVRLASLGGSLTNARPLIEKAATDPSPNVRLAAAELLCRADRCDVALPILAAGLTSNDQYVRLDVANRLDRLGDRSRPLAELMRKALKDPNGDVQKVMRHALLTLQSEPATPPR